MDDDDDGIVRVFQLLSGAGLLDFHLPSFFLLHCTTHHCAAPSFNIICGRQSCFYDTHCKWQALCCIVHCDFRNESERANGQHSLSPCISFFSVSIPLLSLPLSLSYCLSMRFPLVNVLRCRFGCCFCLHPIYVSPIKHMSNVAVVVLLLMLPVVVSLSLLLLLYRPV